MGPNVVQLQVFEEVRPLIQSVVDGINVCILAYGQTGSGKTYTIHGSEENEESVGLIPRTVNELFDLLRINNMISSGFSHVKSVIRCSMVEVILKI